MNLLLSRKEAAVSLCLSISTLDKLLASKELKATKIGRATRIHVDDLETFATRGSVCGTKTRPRP